MDTFNYLLMVRSDFERSAGKPAVYGVGMDEKISKLFQEWLSAFDALQVASGEEAITRAQSRLSEIETEIANTGGAGWECLAIKLGLHRFLNDHTDAASVQSKSAYRDLVRLAGRDPAAEISAHFRKETPSGETNRPPPLFYRFSDVGICCIQLFAKESPCLGVQGFQMEPFGECGVGAGTTDKTARRTQGS